jgi:hypothetical protein
MMAAVRRIPQKINEILPDISTIGDTRGRSILTDRSLTSTSNGRGNDRLSHRRAWDWHDAIEREPSLRDDGTSLIARYVDGILVSWASATGAPSICASPSPKYTLIGQWVKRVQGVHCRMVCWLPMVARQRPCFGFRLRQTVADYGVGGKQWNA